MAALTQDRNTPFKFFQRKHHYKVEGATTIFAGSIVALNAAGFAVPASDTAGLVVIGRAEEQVDNSAGADGDKEVLVAKGVFKWAAGVGIAQALIGRVVAVADDQTVADPANVAITNDITVGILEEIDADGDAWVAVL